MSARATDSATVPLPGRRGPSGSECGTGRGLEAPPSTADWAYAEAVKAVEPTAESFMAAAAAADWEGTPGFGVVLTNESGAGAWPLAGATFILIHKQPKDGAAATDALKFFAWAYAKGDKMALDLDYVPMPDKVVNAIQKVWATQIKDANGKPLFAVTN